MSSQDGSEVAELIAEYAALVVNADCALAASVLIFYEYVITFEKEVDLFWRGRFSGATVLFILNRYIVLTVNILNVCGFMSLTDKSCSLLARSALGLGPMQYLIWAVFSGLRSFALGRSLPIALLVFVLSCVSTGVDLSFFRFDLTGVNIPVLGCTASDTVTAAQGQKFVIAVRTCLIAADAILVYQTWSKLGRSGSLRKRQSFVSVLLRNGTIYFVVLLILSILHLVFTLLSILTPLGATSNITAFTEPITAILVSRFLLDLQDVKRSLVQLDTRYSSSSGAEVSTSTPLETLVFERVLGSIASTISLGNSDALSAEEQDELPIPGRTPSDEIELHPRTSPVSPMTPTN